MRRELLARWLFRPSSVILNVQSKGKTVASYVLSDLRDLLFWLAAFLINLVAALFACLTIFIPIAALLVGRTSTTILPGLLAAALASAAVCFSAAKVNDDDEKRFLKFREAGTAFLKMSLGAVGCLSVSLVRMLAPVYYAFELRDTGFDDVTLDLALLLSLSVLWYLARALFLLVLLLSPPLRSVSLLIEAEKQLMEVPGTLPHKQSKQGRRRRKLIGQH